MWSLSMLLRSRGGSDRAMLIEKCPHCNASHVQTQVKLREGLKENDTSELWNVVRCQNRRCLLLILAVTNNKDVLQQIYPAGTYEIEPNAKISKAIRDDYREAGLCLGAGCFKASMVMSRRVLQRCLKEQGCNQHKLVDAINHAVEHDILRKAFHPVATEIREYGNLGAHPDDDQLENANKQNAEQVFEFARLLIHEFYEVPAAVERLKMDREGQ